MSAGSLGKRWPGAIQDDEHVQAVLRTLAQFVERNVFSISGPSGSANYPKRTGTDDAVNSISELCDLAALAQTTDWLAVLLAHLCGGADTAPTSMREKATLMGFVLAEVIKKVNNPQRTKPLHAFVAGVLDANLVSMQVRELLEKLCLSQTRQSFRRKERVCCDDLAATAEL